MAWTRSVGGRLSRGWRAKSPPRKLKTPAIPDSLVDPTATTFGSYSVRNTARRYPHFDFAVEFRLEFSTLSAVMEAPEVGKAFCQSVVPYQMRRTGSYRGFPAQLPCKRR
jgi:hypothetical protein